jgi:prepilin-type N-terminal cleavage/methylation domain-containing protein
MKTTYMDHAFRKGFTLIEIVLVIALIGVTATLLITLVNPAQQFKKSNDAKRKTDLRQLQAVFELWRADQGVYPDSLPTCGTALTNGTTTYIQKIPCDPKDGTSQFVYTYLRPTINTYELIACLENVSDPQKDTTNNSTYCTGGTTNWSYTLTNP